MIYRSSLIGFHNPYKHRGLTPEKFLTLYVNRLKSMSKKKDGNNRVRLAEWIEANWLDQLKFVSRLFPKTFGLPSQKHKGLSYQSELSLKRNAFLMSLPKYRRGKLKTWQVDEDLKILGKI